MKFNTVRKILVAVGVAILLVGIAGIVWTKASSMPVRTIRNLQATPETALFVPKQAPLMVSFLDNVEQLQAYGLNQLPPEARRTTRSNLNQLRRLIESKTGLDYKSDIFPWAGSETSFAVTTWDVDRDTSNGETWGYLLAIAVGNVERSRSTLESIWQQQSSRWGDLSVEDYSGVRLVYPEVSPKDREDNPSAPLLATAQVGNAYVLFANHANVLRNAVNNVQVSSLNLGNSAAYNNALATLPDERVGLLWVNAQELQSRLNLQPDGSSSTPVKLENISGWLSSVAIAPTGLIADTVILPPVGQRWTAREPRLNQPLQVFRQVPADSALVIGGSNLAALWSRWSAAAEVGDAVAQQLVQPFAKQDEVWGFSFADQVIPWATGEFALAQMRASAIPEASAPEAADAAADWLFVTDASEASAEGMQRLDAIAKEKGLTVGPLPIEDKTALIWSQLEAVLVPDNPAAPVRLRTDVKGIHATLEQHELLATSVGALGKTLFPNRYSLAASAAMQQAIASLEEKNDGYVFVNWDIARPRLAEAFPSLGLLLDWGDPLLESVRSLLISTYGQDPNGIRVGTVIQFPHDKE